jgi:hypothetical protein
MAADESPAVTSPSGGPVRDSLTSTGDMPAPGAFRVLLAEDSRANQMAISRLLKAQARGLLKTALNLLPLLRTGTVCMHIHPEVTCAPSSVRVLVLLGGYAVYN